MERKRLVADRFVRIWSLVETIAAEPGLARSELAQRFALSERQLQADLNLIRDEIGLPLVRLHGYRFEPQAIGSDALNLRDVLTLYLLVQRAAADETFPQEALAEITRKLPLAFPPMLRPLAMQALEPLDREKYGPGPEIFVCLAEALVRQQPVRLRYARRSGVGSLTEPIVDPHILLPYRNVWYLIGRCHQRHRVLMFSLNGLESAALET